MNTIHLWLLPIQNDEIPINILSTPERNRFQKLGTPARRREFLSSRLLLHSALRYFLPDISTKTLVVPDESGRPFWECNGKRLPLYFSLSHTSGMVALAITKEIEIGCDIEKIRPRRYEKELCAKVLTPIEQNIYSKQNTEAAACNFFYKVWTLKEAFVKALGTGLRTPMTSIDFVHSAENSETPCYLETELLGRNWQFYSQTLALEYALAVAIKASSISFAPVSFISWTATKLLQNF